MIKEHRPTWYGPHTMMKRCVLNSVTLLLSFAVAMILSEVLLRVCGFQPWSYNKEDTNEPTMHEPDPILGWQNKAGIYTVPPYLPSGETIHITFLENGRRRTGVNSPVNSAGELVFIGDSFTQGLAISDSETYAWKLQEKVPYLQVLNYGTSAYGTYQSLLMLERELPCMVQPKFVLYGFIGHHEVRNAAPSSWLGFLSKYSRRGHVAVPFTTFDTQKGILRHSPQSYSSWPFREASAVVTVLEEFYMHLKTRSRLLNMRLITEKLLVAMNRVSKEYHAVFVTVLLSSDKNTKEHYIKFLNENHIQVIDCSYEMTDDMRVPGEGHPNAKMNGLWAQCISNKLNNQFEYSRLTNPSRQPKSASPRSCVDPAFKND